MKSRNVKSYQKIQFGNIIPSIVVQIWVEKCTNTFFVKFSVGLLELRIDFMRTCEEHLPWFEDVCHIPFFKCVIILKKYFQ